MTLSPSLCYDLVSYLDPGLSTAETQPGRTAYIFACAGKHVHVQASTRCTLSAIRRSAAYATALWALATSIRRCWSITVAGSLPCRTKWILVLTCRGCADCACISNRTTSRHDSSTTDPRLPCQSPDLHRTLIPNDTPTNRQDRIGTHATLCPPLVAGVA